MGSRAKRSRSQRWLWAAAAAGVTLGVALGSDWMAHGHFPSPPRLAHADPQPNLGFRTAGHGFVEVTDIQFVPGQSHRAIVLQKSGTARLATLSSDGTNSAADSSPIVFEVSVRTQSELGLLGLAFHPKYQSNGLFYVNYDPQDGERRTRVAEWRLMPDRLGKERAVEQRVLLEVAQPYPNHDAGQLVFGPDGMLYIGFGDGGSAGDPQGNGQNLSTLLGSMLRIDVTRRDPGLEYAIPPDNPFVKRPEARGEIWAYGLRNPWRYSFDPQGRLIVADVGQNTYEEVDIVERGNNLGWNVREGEHCFPADASCHKGGFVDPIFEYDHTLGLSITGGFVYTGKTLPALKGKYLFADFGTGRFWALDLPRTRGARARAQLLGQWPRAISTFGRDSAGEIFAGDFGSGDILLLSAP